MATLNIYSNNGATLLQTITADSFTPIRTGITTSNGSYVYSGSYVFCGASNSASSQTISYVIGTAYPISATTNVYIVEKGLNKVIINGSTKLDLSNDTVTADKVLNGYTAHDSSGKAIVGTASGGITPTGTISITSNGTHDVTQYASANVNVPTPTPTIQSLSVTENGTYTAPSGVDGYSPITVNVSGGGTPTECTVNTYSGNSLTSAAVYSQKARPIFTFYGITSLTSVDLSHCTNMTTLTNNAFYTATGLATVTFPSTITTMNVNAFRGCEDFNCASLPTGLETLGTSVFRDCDSLSITALPSGLTSLGQYTFQNCANLGISSFPSGITSIPQYSFSGCTGLTTITLHSAIKSLAQYCFQNCTGLTTVTFQGTPSGTIYSTAFSGCTNLTDIYVPWASGAKAGAPWGATNATVHYNS